MQAVITSEQAKNITGGRTPLVPVEYEEAIRALDACITLDEAKYWNDKASALAAWAKIYRSKDAEIKAKRLRLHAYRRMGQLAEELRPRKGLGRGSAPGPRTLLIESGLSGSAATAARRLAAIPQADFDKSVAVPRPKSPTHLLTLKRFEGSSDAWRVFNSVGGPLFFRSYCRKHDAASLARSLLPDEAKRAKQIAREVCEWLDEFDQHLARQQ